MNPATLVTAIRIVLSPAFFFLYTTGIKDGVGGPGVIIALWLVFGIIEVSDFVDGRVARSTGTVTDIGKIFDPFADSFARLTYFLSFLVAGIMPAWVFLLVLYRDLGVSFVRLLAMKAGVAMSAQLSGKIKAFVYAFAGIAGLLVVTVRSFGLESFVAPVDIAAKIFFWICAATAVWTMIDYAAAYRRIAARK